MNFPPTLTADDLDREREQILERMKSARAQQAAADARRQRMAMAEQQLQQAQPSDDRTVFTEGGFSQITDLKAAPKFTRNSGGRNSGAGPPPSASSGYGPGANAAGSVSIAGQSRHSGSGSGIGSRHSGSGAGSGNESTMLGPSTVVGQQSAVGSFLMKAPWGSSGVRRSSKTRGGNSSDTSIATGMTNSVVRQAANYVHSAQEGSKRFQQRQLSGRSGGSGLTEEEEEQRRMKALAATAGSAVGSATDPQMAAKDRVERLSREVGSRQPLHSVDEGYEDEPSRAAPSQSGRSSKYNSSAQRQQPSRRDMMDSATPAKSTRRMDAPRAQSQPSHRNVADRRPQNLPPIGQPKQQQMAGQRPALSAARSAPSSRNAGGMSMAPSSYHAPSFGTSQQRHHAPPSPSGPLPMAIPSAAVQDEMREYISPTQLQNRKILLGITVMVGVFACCGYGWLMVSRKMSVYSNVVPDTSVGTAGGSSSGSSAAASAGRDGGSNFSTREAGFKDILRGIIEPRDAFDDVRSPQSRALNWMVYEDPLQLEPPRSAAETNKIAQRFALTVLFYATGGDTWVSPHNFLSGEDECEWNSVDDRGYFSGAGQCDRDGMITTVALWQNNLFGRIPAELAALRKLKVLSLYRNKLQGQVPGRLSQLSDIHTLYLHDNELSGTVDHMCQIEIQNFRSDCFDGEGRGTQMVICSCCNVCCNRDRQCFQM